MKRKKSDSVDNQPEKKCYDSSELYSRPDRNSHKNTLLTNPYFSRSTPDSENLDLALSVSDLKTPETDFSKTNYEMPKRNFFATDDYDSNTYPKRDDLSFKAYESYSKAPESVIKNLDEPILASVEAKRPKMNLSHPMFTKATKKLATDSNCDTSKSKRASHSLTMEKIMSIDLRCELCQKKMPDVISLVQHLRHGRTHLSKLRGASTKYYCELCDKDYSGKDMMINHLKSVSHEAIVVQNFFDGFNNKLTKESFDCAYCGVEVSDIDNIVFHLLSDEHEAKIRDPDLVLDSVLNKVVKKVQEITTEEPKELNPKAKVKAGECVVADSQLNVLGIEQQKETEELRSSVVDAAEAGSNVTENQKGKPSDTNNEAKNTTVAAVEVTEKGNYQNWIIYSIKSAVK